MKVEKTSKSKYRIRKRVNGKIRSYVFNHEPTEKEIALAVAEMEEDDRGIPGSFEHYANDYNDNRNSVLSPSTIRTYKIKLNQLSESFKAKNLYDISNEDVQIEINRLSKDHEPKTVKTTYGYIASVFGAYRPSLRLKVKLPQKIEKSLYEPSSDDIKRILESAKETKYSIPFQLGVLSCRRGEICALSVNDLSGNELRIHRNKVYQDGKWIVKETPKTDASNRIIHLPDKLADEIREKGYIYDGHPNALNKAIHRFQKQLGIPQFKFHTLRSYFASYAHSMGVPESDILSLGGWASPSIMKSVYRKSLEESKRKSIEKISDII